MIIAPTRGINNLIKYDKSKNIFAERGRILEKRITITDLARMCGVSPGSVHRALYNKPGVGDAVRARVLEAARQSGYRPNSAASALKRRPLRVVASFPGPTEENRYFYLYVWQGFRDYLQEISDYNIEAVELPYYQGRDSQGSVLESVLAQYGDIDGMITVGHTDRRGEAAIRRYIGRGIPVALVCDDIENCGRMVCVQASHDITGAVVAEQLASQIAPGQGVLVVAGDVMVPSHFRMVQGFDGYLQRYAPTIRSIKIHGYHNQADVRARTVCALQTDPSIAAVCSVNARGSVMLGEVLRELGLTGKLRAIGSDVFAENLQALREGVFTNIVYKNPRRQAYLGAKLLMDYLIRDEPPEAETLYVDSTLVFRSNLSNYESGPG